MPKVSEAKVVLSVRQPWAWLIVHAGKDIENRTWYGRHRGPLLIHAAGGMTRQEYDECQEWVMDEVAWHMPNGVLLPAFAALERGGIVGQVEMVDCVTASDSPWFVGPYGFVLKDARPLPFTPCKGALGFFNLPLGVVVNQQQNNGTRGSASLPGL